MKNLTSSTAAQNVNYSALLEAWERYRYDIRDCEYSTPEEETNARCRYEVVHFLNRYQDVTPLDVAHLLFHVAPELSASMDGELLLLDVARDLFRNAGKEA